MKLLKMVNYFIKTRYRKKITEYDESCKLYNSFYYITRQYSDINEEDWALNKKEEKINFKETGVKRC